MKTYLINIAGTNLYKIGRSIEPEARLAQLASSQPYDYQIVAVCGIDIELKLHKHFAKYKHNSPNSREWFCFDDQVLRQVFLLYAQPALLDKRAKPWVRQQKLSDSAIKIVSQIFKDCLDREHIILNKLDVYAHPLFSKLAEQCGINISEKARHKWFWSLLRKHWQLDFKCFGKGVVKYKFMHSETELHLLGLL